MAFRRGEPMKGEEMGKYTLAVIEGKDAHDKWVLQVNEPGGSRIQHLSGPHVGSLSRKGHIRSFTPPRSVRSLNSPDGSSFVRSSSRKLDSRSLYLEVSGAFIAIFDRRH
jgi:hypothetical protein